jgi:hypothetical protein
MIDQKENPSLLGSSTTVQALGLSPQPKITQLQAQISRCSSSSIVPNDRKVVSIVLENNGCELSIDWTHNPIAKNYMARWVHPLQNLIVDVFENAEGKVRISMHHLREWQSPQDHLMPRFAKSIAYAISAAGASVRYKQDALAKYEKGGLSDE